ncbi:MAG: hypothetical protein KUG75_08745 [Pseudomonadales bacterium]|nr:hypothetical protein [Pseudomonadales bacterium]
MNWEAIGAIGEIVGAMSVFLTLIYLAAQIRQNTSAVKVAAVDAAVHHVSTVRQALFSDDELVGINMQGNDDPSRLDEKALIRYRLVIHNILMSVSNIHTQSLLTGLTRSYWESHIPVIERILSTAGGAWFWSNFRQEFEESFRDEVDKFQN